ncbi:hypothetical protein BCR35DRAFT_310872 [Leucosporidium creatinivorum]|uniref:BTB domain-containing protein n=1 Tax=Leucosporidium creatinivorum TaxID=106004 RepID=A0A1Y2CQ01_9BASI|nr:hypothetical protein BCR35DRAFT_310872 [Leucosporidium creatinivorum]
MKLVKTTFTFTSPPMPFDEQLIQFPPSLSNLGSWIVFTSPTTAGGTFGGHICWEGVGDLSRITKLEWRGAKLFKGFELQPGGDLLSAVKEKKDGECYFGGFKESDVRVSLRVEMSGEEAAVNFTRAASSFADVLSCRHHADVRSYFPRFGRDLWTSSALLSSRSPYVAQLFKSGFSESQMKRTPSQLGKKDVEEGRTKSSAFDDSDDERDEVLTQAGDTQGGSRVAEDSCSHPFHEFVVTETAYTTYRAVVVYLATGHISFAPLTSTLRAAGASSGDGGTPRNLASTVQDPSSLLPASPKSVYRLAHLLSLVDLQDLALASINSQLTIDNVAYELFSEVTSVYDEIAAAVVAFASKHWAEVKQSSAMKEMESRVLRGETELSGKVSMKLMKLL